MRIWAENMQEEGIDAWPGRQMVGVSGGPLHLSASARLTSWFTTAKGRAQGCNGG